MFELTRFKDQENKRLFKENSEVDGDVASVDTETLVNIMVNDLTHMDVDRLMWIAEQFYPVKALDGCSDRIQLLIDERRPETWDDIF